MINAISFFKELTIRGEVPRKNIIEAQRSLDQIPPQLTSSQHDAYYQIFEFVSTAIEFYKFWYTYDRDESLTPGSKAERAEKRPVSASPNVHSSNYSSISKYQSNEKNFRTQYSSVASNHNTTQSTLEKNYSNLTTEKKQSPMMGYFEDNLQKSSDSLKKLGEKRKDLEEKIKSIQKGSQLDMKTPTKNLAKSFDRFDSSKSFDHRYNTTSGPTKTTQDSASTKKVQFTPSSNSTSKKNLGISKSPLTAQLENEQDIEEVRKEAQEYKSRVGKMLAEHDRYVTSKVFWIKD